MAVAGGGSEGLDDVIAASAAWSIDGHASAEPQWSRVHYHRVSVGSNSASVTAGPAGPGELSRLEASVASLRTGLDELEASPSYLMLRDADPGSVTAGRYRAAAGQGFDLWPVVDAVADRLEAIRSRWGDDDAKSAVEVARPVGFADLGPTTPAHALAALRKRYDVMAAEVSAVDRVWLTVLPRVEAARETLGRLQSEADALDLTEPLIGRARSRADDLADRLLSDPCAVEVSDGQRLDSEVAEVARLMARARSGHDNYDTDLAGAGELLAELRILLARAAASTAETRAKISDPGGLITLPSRAIIDGSGGLADRLDEVFEPDPVARWEHRRAMLDRWLAQATSFRKQLLRALEVSGAALERRDELRGRLQAFEVKMAAVGRAEDPGLVAIVERAWDELYTAPTNLDAAEKAVSLLARDLHRTDSGPNRGDS